MPSRPRARGPLAALVALFTAGYLAPYLLPTVVGRLAAGLGLGPSRAGLMGSVLLLGSATAGFALAARVERIGPRRAARAGLLAMLLGYGSAAATGTLPLVVAGVVLGGLGSGTATAVAASGIAGRPDPQRASTLGLLSVSAVAAALYLTLPRLGGGHEPPLLALAAAAVLVWPVTGRLPGAARPDRGAPRAGASGPLPHLRAGAVLAGCILCWSLAQNALWGVSGRIGTGQAGLSEVTVGGVFALALGAGLTGVTTAGALGPRLGRAVPIGAGTVLIAGCVLLSSTAGGLASFATGEILWNALYPVVLSCLLGLAASLDPRGRWAVLVGSASSLGTACGPVTGSVLSETAGYPGMGAALGALLLLVAAPMTAVALYSANSRPSSRWARVPPGARRVGAGTAPSAAPGLSVPGPAPRARLRAGALPGPGPGAEAPAGVPFRRAHPFRPGGTHARGGTAARQKAYASTSER
ncbi:MFS transporter [Streptomyces filamentosus]|uniref:MFS transporter n=1 Tax=Streptomyces filamentosus TaxID=67294 RepID=UPI0036ED2E3F